VRVNVGVSEGMCVCGGDETVDAREIASVCLYCKKTQSCALESTIQERSDHSLPRPPSHTHSTMSWCVCGVWGGRRWFVRTGVGELGHVRTSLREIGALWARLG